MSFVSTSNVTLIYDDNNTVIITVDRKDTISMGRIPSRLKKTLCCTLALFIIGVLLLIMAIIQIVRKDEFWDGGGFLFLSVVMLIPGMYYLVMFIKAKRSKDIDQKREVYENIPEI